MWVDAGDDDELRGRIGGEQLAAIEARELLFWKLLRPPWFILCLAGVFALIFWQLDAYAGTEVFGAFVGRLVSEGEVFRFVTAGFVHVDLEHLVANSRSLIIFGWFVGAAIGVPRMAILLFVSDVASCLAILSVLDSFPGSSFVLSVGSSAGLWGLYGASLLLLTFRRQDIPVGFRALSMILWLFVTLKLFTTWHESSAWGLTEIAHLAGGLVGLALGILFLWDARSIPLAENPKLRRAVAVIIVIIVASGGLAIRNQQLFGNDLYQGLLAAELAAPNTSDESRSQLSLIVVDSDPIPVDLVQLALSTMVDLVARDPEQDHRRVLARLYHRIGEPERAIEMMRALWMEEIGVPETGKDTSTYLARLYDAGTYDIADIQVTGTETDDGANFVVTLAAATAERSVVHALMYEDDELAGLIEIYIVGGYQESQCPMDARALRGHKVEDQSIKPVWIGPPAASAVKNTCSLAWVERGIVVHPSKL
jgi:membrane associated rhomboid family serine protease